MSRKKKAIVEAEAGKIIRKKVKAGIIRPKESFIRKIQTEGGVFVWEKHGRSQEGKLGGRDKAKVKSKESRGSTMGKLGGSVAWSKKRKKEEKRGQAKKKGSRRD